MISKIKMLNFCVIFFIHLPVYSMTFKDTEAFECLKIITGSLAAAVFYGVVHHQITAKKCPEYFDEHFNQEKIKSWKGPFYGRLKNIIKNTKSPTLVGFIAGITTPLRMGLYLSIPVLLASRLGEAPKLKFDHLIIPAMVVLSFIGLYSAHEGVKEYYDKEKIVTDATVSTLDTLYGFSGKCPQGRLPLLIAFTKSHQAASQASIVVGLSSIGFIIGQRLTMK